MARRHSGGMMNMLADEKEKPHWRIFNKPNAAILVMAVLVLAAVSLFFVGGPK